MSKAQDYARVGYEAYKAAAGGRSLVTGDVLPPFDDLSEAVKKGWRAAACEIIQEIAAEIRSAVVAG